jgi:hypothetical protein
MYKGVQLEFFITREIMVSQLISMVNWNIRQNVTLNKIKSLKKIHMTLTKINTSNHDIFLFECLKHFLLYNSNRNYSEVCYDWTNWIHLSLKEDSLFVLFCTDEIHWTGMLEITFLVSLERSRGGGVHELGFMTFGLAM